MSAAPQNVVRRCARCLIASRTLSLRAALIAKPQTAFQGSRRWQSTEVEASMNPKIAGIVDQISQLTLLETADLVSTLKVRETLNPIVLMSPY